MEKPANAVEDQRAPRLAPRLDDRLHAQEPIAFEGRYQFEEGRQGLFLDRSLMAQREGANVAMVVVVIMMIMAVVVMMVAI